MFKSSNADHSERPSTAWTSKHHRTNERTTTRETKKNRQHSGYYEKVGHIVLGISQPLFQGKRKERSCRQHTPCSDVSPPLRQLVGLLWRSKNAGNTMQRALPPVSAWEEKSTATRVMKKENWSGNFVQKLKCGPLGKTQYCMDIETSQDQ